MAAEPGCAQLTNVMPCRHESDTTDLYCIFDPDTAHRLAGWGRHWSDNHRLGQADVKVGPLYGQCKVRNVTKLREGGTDPTVCCRPRRVCWTASSQA